MVPAYSIPYTVDENGEPIYDMKTYNADVKSEKLQKQEAEAAEKKRNSKQAPYICEGLFHICLQARI